MNTRSLDDWMAWRNAVDDEIGELTVKVKILETRIQNMLDNRNVQHARGSQAMYLTASGVAGFIALVLQLLAAQLGS